MDSKTEQQTNTEQEKIKALIYDFEKQTINKKDELRILKNKIKAYKNMLKKKEV